MYGAVKCEIATWHCDCVVLLYRYRINAGGMWAVASWNYKHKHYIMARGLYGCYGTVLYGASINIDIDMRWVGGGWHC